MPEEFDFVVVGAGSAGCAVAARLSEDGRHSVLLAEAGGADTDPLIRVPMAAGLVYFRRAINWNLEIAPQSDMDGRTVPWPRGKVLGGSSSINGMMYMRGHRRDYDDWAQTGLPGWGYADVLPYFKRAEGHAQRRDAFHGTQGPFRVVKAKGDNPLYRAFLEAAFAAAPEHGARPNDDFNGADQEGLGLYDFNIRNGRRESAATAYLRPAHGRKNLEIRTGALARHVVIEEGRAVGVAFRRNGREEVVRARREVILCGGAVATPGILERSGIGDPEVLRAAGIEPRLERPAVGANLHDHLGVYLTYACAKPVTLYGLMRTDRALIAGARALLFGTGPATSVPLEAGGFLRTRPELEIPDIHMTFVPGLNLETTRSGQGRHGYLINFYPLRPESRGTVHVRSAEPDAAPLIDPAYLSAEADRRVMRDGVRLAEQIGAGAPLRDWQAGRLSPEAPLETDEAIDAWVRATANTIFHPVGSCRMGADAAAVVDAELKVRGVEGLRVADASVMPRIVGGNTSAPTMMIGEKAADLVLGRPPPPAEAAA